MRAGWLVLIALSCKGEPVEAPTDLELDACEVRGPDSAPIRKLTQVEYGNTVRDLTGLDIDAASRLLADPEAHGFDNNSQLISVSQLQADGYMRASEDVTAALALSDLLPCDPAEDEDACAEQFIAEFGARAFRRPLDDTEADIYVALFQSSRDAEGFDMGISLIIQAILQSPQFLYRPELGDGSTGLVALTDYELATRLSYLLWESTPDPPLMDAAAAGELSGTIAEHTARMLEDPKARRALSHFTRQWTGVDDVHKAVKDGTTYPEWDEDLGRDMAATSDAFVEGVVFDGEGTLEGLFTAPYEWDKETRLGLLTQPALLTALSHANQTSVVLRGVFVRERLMCHELQPPPDDLDISLPPLDPSLSTRERFARHMQDPACSGCHTLTDPIGLGFEHYGALGEWREEEAPGVPVDASGLVIGGADLDGTFYGVDELSDRLATSPTVQTCFVLNTFRNAFGREPGDADACVIRALEEGFAASGGDIQRLLMDVTATPTFQTRPAVEP